MTLGRCTPFALPAQRTLNCHDQPIFPLLMEDVSWLAMSHKQVADALSKQKAKSVVQGIAIGAQKNEKQNGIRGWRSGHGPVKGKWVCVVPGCAGKPEAL